MGASQSSALLKMIGVILFPFARYAKMNAGAIYQDNTGFVEGRLYKQRPILAPVIIVGPDGFGGIDRR